jgi:hypothetical protein
MLLIGDPPKTWIFATILVKLDLSFITSLRCFTKATPHAWSYLSTGLVNYRHFHGLLLTSHMTFGIIYFGAIGNYPYLGIVNK